MDSSSRRRSRRVAAKNSRHVTGDNSSFLRFLSFLRPLHRSGFTPLSRNRIRPLPTNGHVGNVPHSERIDHHHVHNPASPTQLIPLGRSARVRLPRDFRSFELCWPARVPRVFAHVRANVATWHPASRSSARFRRSIPGRQCVSPSSAHTGPRTSRDDGSAPASHPGCRVWVR